MFLIDILKFPFRSKTDDREIVGRALSLVMREDRGCCKSLSLMRGNYVTQDDINKMREGVLKKYSFEESFIQRIYEFFNK